MKGKYYYDNSASEWWQNTLRNWRYHEYGVICSNGLIKVLAQKVQILWLNHVIKCPHCSSVYFCRLSTGAYAIAAASTEWIALDRVAHTIHTACTCGLTVTALHGARGTASSPTWSNRHHIDIVLWAYFSRYSGLIPVQETLLFKMLTPRLY